MKRIAVVGAGVSGLSCAVSLLEAGCSVRILSKEQSLETTSGVAAALWFPFRAYPLDKVVDWSLVTLERFRDLERFSESGISTRRVAELYRQEPPPPQWRTRLEGFRILERGEISAGFHGGYSLLAPVIDSSRYLPFLFERAIALGATFVTREVEDLAGLADECDLVVNCSGTGARTLADDPDVVPIRGQVLRVEKGSFDEVSVDEGSTEAAYIVPRTHDCILGTTIEEGIWDRTPSEESSRDIVTRCAELDPRVRHARILEARVGLRPGRHEVRLEVTHEGGLPLVHNYGHGGSGYTLSWGCAREVVRMVQSL